MKRYFYIGDDLKDLKLISSELEGRGFSKPQIHLISKNHGSSYLDSLMPINHDFIKSLFRKEIFITVALFISLVVAGVTTFLQFQPIIITAFSILTLLTFYFIYKGIGSEQYYDDFDQSEIKQQLERGRHILLVELNDAQEQTLDNVIINHPKVEAAGIHDH